jgi:dolichyl-diphosphooligosaccharide--protein glycosyltransferase
MAAAQESQFLKQASGPNTRGLLRVIILVLIAGAAVSSRLFSVIRFESIIHECTLLSIGMREIGSEG